MGRIGTYVSNPATDAQINLMVKLHAQMWDLIKGIATANGDDVSKMDDARDRDLAEVRNLVIGKADASKRIDAMINRTIPMLKTELKAVTPVVAVVRDRDGIYLVDGDVIKCQYSGTGNLYGKVWDADSLTFVYTPGAQRRCNETNRMSMDEAVKFGALYGMCCVCGRTLRDETSIEAGIGPVCAGKL